jgi:sulfate/thiosulfate transport system substrate-binding protein
VKAISSLRNRAAEYLGAGGAPVAIVDKRGTRKIAQACLQYLYSPEGQEIVARNFYRPRDPTVAAKYANVFPAITLATINDFVGWDKAQAAYFADGGLFDQIYVPGK